MGYCSPLGVCMLAREGDIPHSGTVCHKQVSILSVWRPETALSVRIMTKMFPLFPLCVFEHFLQFKNNKVSGLERKLRHLEAGCSCKEPGFNSQYPSDCSHSSVTPGPGDSVPSPGLMEHCSHTVHRHTCR